MVFSHRVATPEDVPAIIALMDTAIERNMREFLSAAEIESVKESMGVDQTLIEDGSYFLIEAEVEGEIRLVGCGGWGRRRTLYGGDHTAGRDDSVTDPATEAARIRAMYTHPDWTRRGIGTLILALGENAAREAGYRSIELGATVAGEPLYRARGYVELSRDRHVGRNGEQSVVILMQKPL